MRAVQILASAVVLASSATPPHLCCLTTSELCCNRDAIVARTRPQEPAAPKSCCAKRAESTCCHQVTASQQSSAPTECYCCVPRNVVRAPAVVIADEAAVSVAYWVVPEFKPALQASSVARPEVDPGPRCRALPMLCRWNC